MFWGCSVREINRTKITAFTELYIKYHLPFVKIFTECAHAHYSNYVYLNMIDLRCACFY